MYRQEKDRMKQAIEIENREGREEKCNKPTARTQERRQHARGIRIHQARKEREGGVAPRRNNRITESATQETREAKRKAKKATEETNGKRQGERTQRTKKGTRKRNTENDKKERKNEEEKEKRKKRKKEKENGKGVRAALLCWLLGSQRGGRIVTMMAIPRRQSCLLYTSPSPRDKRQSRMPSSA